MISLLRTVSSILILTVVAGCTTASHYPHTRGEFVSTYGEGGLFNSAEHFTVDRETKSVIADVKNYAKKCLDIRVNLKRAGRYKTEKYGAPSTAPPVTFNTKVETARDGSTYLSVQEFGLNIKGEPPGGLFTLVAEIRAAGKNKTKVDLYHIARPFIANPLKQWVRGDEYACPAL